MFKAEPHADYPPEEGRYLRGNDYSPVALAVILIYNQEEIPPDIEDQVQDHIHEAGGLWLLLPDILTRHGAGERRPTRSGMTVIVARGRIAAQPRLRCQE